MYLILLRVAAPVKILLLAALPVCLYFIPVDKMNEEHTICLFKNLTGHECWGCGITRATISAIQFDFTAAFQYNKLIVAVFPLLVYVWGKTIFKILNK
ncbi:MAG: DUF2752 domain-containing protein, partial [Prevotellaceae bacterium]|nr:DUF2752 domain-containing protein [Prevotellaceae bacterium]